MENFQLYRTNLFLGGQMKWDIVLDTQDSILCVSDFHLRPISNNVPYTYESDEKLLNNSHTDNIKLYYNKVKGNFYNEYLDSEFNHNWPIICKENEVLNAYSNIYDMGCRRMKSYKLYKKQFEYFCPLWIEHLNGDLKFKFEIKPVGSDTILSSKVLNISQKSANDFHNKFVDYFNTYIKAAELDNGDDNLMKIEFKNSSTRITGFNAATGLFCTKSIDNLVNNMLLRERPLMETDNMIIQSFVNNTILAKQLFNFNICFNLEDLISKRIYDMLNGENLNVKLSVYIGDTLLDKRDFYTNYDFIERSVSGSDEKLNVLDYLKDYKCIELINKNKFNQPICHWSLSGKSDYIFNVYEGFSGIYVENTEDSTIYHENTHQYRDFPNLNTNNDNKATSKSNWINTEQIVYWGAFYKYISNTSKNKKLGNYIFGNEFINGIKYKTLPKIEVNGKKGFYVIGLNITKDIERNIKNHIERYNLIYIPITETLMMLRKDDLVMFVTINGSELSFKNFSKIMNIEKDNIYKYINMMNNNDFEDEEKNLGKEAVYFDTIYEMISGIIPPSLLMFSSGLKYTPVNLPINNSDNKNFEIEYIKDNISKNYMFRYDGKIKPSFVSEPKNVLYFKDYISDNRIGGVSKLTKSNYMKFINTGYEPNYPSIDYCSIKPIEIWNYSSLPEIQTSEHESIQPLINIEYSWFDDNVCLPLQPILTGQCENKCIDGHYKTLNEILKEYISNFYNIDDKNTIDYIISKYSIESNWEYASETNVEDYIYDITLTLK